MKRTAIEEDIRHHPQVCTGAHARLAHTRTHARVHARTPKEEEEEQEEDKEE